MAKALVIKDTDFSENKITTVDFGEIPCTALSLNKSSATISTVDGTETIVATKTPSNSTDVVTWTSSAPSVATVIAGVVTAIKEGTATITATCGNITATCSVTVSYELMFTGSYAMTVEVVDSALKDYAGVHDPTSSLRPISVCAHSGIYSAFGAGRVASQGALKDAYPIPIPAGCTSIKVTCENFAPLVIFYKRKETSTGTVYRTCAKVVDGETYKAGTDWTISGWDFDLRTITVPSNCDSYTLTFQSETSTDHDNFSLSDISIEYLYAT